jgi:glycosyltransferase involved in cell wall biosynthesis
MLKELKKRHYVTFLTLTAPSASSDWHEKSSEYCHEIIAVPWRETLKYTWSFYGDLMKNMLVSNLPYAIEKYRSPEMEGKIKELSECDYDLVICDFLFPAVNMNGNFVVPTLLFQHNVESQIWKRHYLEQTRLVQRIYFRMQWKRMVAFEKHSCGRFGGVVTVSTEDTETLRQEFGLKNILGDVPTGVDTGYFYPNGESPKRSNHIVFTGSMDWLPNEDAAMYFMAEIYPRIKDLVPEVSLAIVGRNPSNKLKDSAKLDPSVYVTGTVEDIRPYISTATALVVPLRIGGGTRIKIFEGMAMGVPIVSTTVGAEGLPVVHNRDILMADEPEGFAYETVSLLKNASKAKAIADSALHMVREHYTWQAVSGVFESHCFNLLEKHSGRVNEN